MRRTRVALFSLLGIVGALALVVTVAVVVAFSIDFGRYKSNAEELVSERLSREFRIGGAFELTLGRRIRLLAEDVRLAGTDWSDAGDLVSVERLELSIDTWSIFRGPIVVETLSIEGTKINLEELEDGRDNWTLATQQPSDEEAEDAADERIGELPLILNELQVNNFKLNLLSPALRRPLHLSLEKVREAILETGDVQLDISGQLNDKVVAIAAVAGKVENLVKLRDVALKLEGQLGEISFQGSATVDDLLAPGRPTGELRLQGPNAEYLSDILGLDPITTGPLSLDTSVAPAAERMNIAVSGVFGEFTLDVSGSLVDLGNWRDMDIRATASGPDASTIGRLVGNDTVPADPFRIHAAARIAGRNIQIDMIEVEIGETRFDARGQFADFPRPHGASLALHVSGPDFGRFNRLLGMPGKLTGPFNLDFVVTSMPDDKASVNLSAVANDLALTLDAEFVDAPNFTGTTISANGNGPNFAVIAAAAGLLHAPSDSFELKVSAEKTEKGISVSSSQIRIGKDLLNLSGFIGNEPLAGETDLRLQAAGPDLVSTLTAFGRESNRRETSSWSVDGRVYRGNNLFLVENLRATVGNDRILLNGQIGNQPLVNDSNVTFDLSTKEFRETLSVFGIESQMVPAGALNASGRIRVRERIFEIEGMTAKLAGANMRVAGRLGELPALNGTNLKVSASGSDLSKLVTLESPFVVLDKPFQLGGTARIDRGVLKVTDLKFSLDQSNLDAQFDVQLRPMAGSGRFLVSTDVPDLLSLAPRSSEIFAADTIPMQLKADGKWKDGLWTFGDISMHMGKGVLKISGTIDQPPDVDRTDLIFDWTIGSMQNFSLLAGYELPDHAAQLQFHLTGTRDTLSVDNLRAQFGDSDLTGSLDWHYGDRARMETAFKSTRLNLAAYLPPEAESQEAETAEPAGSAQRLIPDTRIPAERLNEFDASLDVEILELVLRNRSLRDVILKATLKDGALDVPTIRLRNDAGGTLSGAAALRPVATGVDLLIDMQGSGLSPGFLTENREDVAMLPKLDLDTVLVGSGATYAELAGSLNGYMRVTGGEGRIRSSALRYVTSDFLTELIKVVNPFTRTDPYTNVRCSALLLRFGDGTASGKPAIVSQSDKIQVFVNLNVDLKSEKLSADIRTVPQKGLGVSVSNLVNPYVKVSGTLANPTLVLDPKGALIEGGAAVATAGLSILAKSIKDRFLSPKDQCGKAVEEAAGDFEQLRKKYRPEQPE